MKRGDQCNKPTVLAAGCRPQGVQEHVGKEGVSPEEEGGEHTGGGASPRMILCF